METTAAEVLYEEQQGSEHTHTVGHRGTPAITDANVFTTPIPLLSLIPLNRSFISPPSFSYTAPRLLSISSGQPVGSWGLVQADTSLSHGAAKVEAQILIYCSHHTTTTTTPTPTSSTSSSSCSPGTRAKGLSGGSGGLH